MDSQRQQLSSFLAENGTKARTLQVSFGEKTSFNNQSNQIQQELSLSSLSLSQDPSYYQNNTFQNGDPTSMQISHLRNLIALKTRKIQDLQAEIESLIRIQKNQASQLTKTLQERDELEKKLKQTHNNMSQAQRMITESISRPHTTIYSERQNDIPFFMEHALFLRCMLEGNQANADDILQQILQIQDRDIRGKASQALLFQAQRFLALNNSAEKICDEYGKDSFVSLFENQVRTLLDCHRLVLWIRVPSARVWVSQTLSTLIPEGSGLLGRILDDQRLLITDPKTDSSYSPDFDDQLLATAKCVLFEPVVNSKKELIWIIEMIDRLDSSGDVIPPSSDDIMELSFFARVLSQLYQEESRLDGMIKKILTDSTKNMLTHRQVMPLFETVKMAVNQVIGCEVLQIFFADQTKDQLFQINENDINLDINKTSDHFGRDTNEESSFVKIPIDVDNAGIAGFVYRTKKTVNIVIAKEHQKYSPTVDGEFPNGSLLAVPLVNSKGNVILVSVARQKRSGMMFTNEDEIMLEALSRVSSGALVNAQSHERNLNEIRRALTNHKYYTALLSIAQELSSELDTDILVRKIMTKAQTFIGADRCSLFLVDKERGGLWSLVAHGANEKIHIQIGEGIAGSVVAKGETINIPDAYEDPRFNSNVDRATGYITKSILCVPIRNRDGSIMGCTQMINKLGGEEFTSTDVQLMSAFNVFCGIALSNAQLYESATRSKKKMGAMLDVALSLTSAQQVNTLIQIITVKAKELLETDYCWVFIIDKARHLCKPLAAEKSQTIEFSSNLGIVGYVIQTGATINTENPEEDLRFEPYFCKQIGLTCKSVLAMPVNDEANQAIGVILAVNKKDALKFTDDDQQLMKAFTAFTGLALAKWTTKKNANLWADEASITQNLSPQELQSFNVPVKLRIISPLSETVASLDFAVLSFPKKEHFRIILHFFSEFGLLNEFEISVGTLFAFLDQASQEYNHVPYHNWNHAMDVVQLIYYQLKIGNLGHSFTKIQLFALLIAAICHDMGHSGKSNSFNVKAQTPLSLLYKDQPVMETFHCAKAIKTVAKPNCNILASLSAERTHEFWSYVVEDILATDVQAQQKIIREAMMQMANDKPLDLDTSIGQTTLMKLLLKVADLSNMIRPFDVGTSWANILVEECVSQGDEEQKLGIGYTSPMNERNGISMARSQVLFFQNYGIPLINTIVKAVPDLAPIKDQFEINFQRWKDITSGLK